jgi:hypothetical protein
MVLDYDKWHDGVGYDLDALREASPAERGVIESMLLRRSPLEWRDVEALALLDTPRAREALRAAMQNGDAEVRAAVTRAAPHLVSQETRTASLVAALRTATFYGGLAQTLWDVEDFHPPPVVDALLSGALAREGDAAVHFAAMLFFLHGKSSEPFDLNHRPLFLRFNTSDRERRVAAFRDLCAAIGVDANPYLGSADQPR